MSHEIKTFLDYLTSQTGLSVEAMAEEIAAALEQVVVRTKQYPEEAEIKVQIDSDNGEMEIFRVFQIVEEKTETFNPENEITIADAEAMQVEAGMQPDAKAGQSIYQALDVDLGRIAATQAKQLFKKIIYDGQQQKQKRLYQDKVGTIIIGTVKKVTREYLIVEIAEHVDGVLYKTDMIPRENFRVDEKIKAEITTTESEYRNAIVQLSRTSGNFLRQLFSSEVPEIHEGSIEIKAIARDPGSRAKIAVKSNDRRVDPIGACIGMKGTRVQAVSNELGGERIDIILWEDSPAKMVIASLAPGEVSSISVDEENQSMEINVDPSQLAQIIGRNGQNIRLATQLSGWTLNLNKSTETNSISPKDALVESLGVDEEVAEILIRDGFETVQAVAAAGIAKLAETEEFDEEIAEAIYEQAKSSQLELTLTAENEESTRTYVLEGFSNLSRSQAQALARQDINTQDALAELAIDELRDIIDLSEETAGQIILAARAPWFNDTDNQEN